MRAALPGAEGHLSGAAHAVAAALGSAPASIACYCGICCFVEGCRSTWAARSLVKTAWGCTLQQQVPAAEELSWELMSLLRC